MRREDIETLAQLWGVEVGKSSSNEVVLGCPFAPYGGHKGPVDRTPNFGVKVNENGRSVAHCFACQRGGMLVRVAERLVELNGKNQGALDFVRKAERMPFIPGAVRAKTKPKFDKSLLRTMRAVTRGEISPILKKRGVLDSEIRRYQLAYDPMRDRDVFPVYDHKQRLRGIIGRRVYAEDETKYFNYGNAMDLTRCFFGEQFIDPTHETAILVEGPLDVLKVSRVYKNALGLCGNLALTEDRIGKLKKWFDHVTLMLDSDAAGMQGMFRLGLILTKKFSVDVALLPDGLDPWDCTPQQIRQAYENRVLWSLVNWKGGKQT